MRIGQSFNALPPSPVSTGGGPQPEVTEASTMAPDRFMARTRTPEFQKLTALQRHAAFFDQNGDRRLTFSEIKQGFKDLGANAVTSSAAAGVFVAAFGPLTNGKPSLTVNLDRIERGKHPSDTEAFDAQGRANPERVQHLMTYDTNHSDSLSRDELKHMIADNKHDVRGNVTSKAEFGLLLAVGADKTELDAAGKPIPAISRGRLQSFYDGTLFYQLAAKNGHPHPRRD